MALYAPTLTLSIPGPAFPVEETRERYTVDSFDSQVRMARDRSQIIPRRWTFPVELTTAQGQYLRAQWRASSGGTLPFTWTSDEGESVSVFIANGDELVVAFRRGDARVQLVLEEAL